MSQIYKSIVAVLLIASQVDCFAFGIWPAPQPYAIIRAHQNLVSDFSRFLQRDLPNLVYGPGPREYTLPPHSPNHGFQQFGPSPQPNPGFQQFEPSPQPNPGFQQFNSPPLQRPGFPQFGPQQHPLFFGLPSPLPPPQFLGGQPNFIPSDFAHQPASFYGPPPSYISPSLPPQYPYGVSPSVRPPHQPISIPQSEIQLPTTPAIGYLPSQSGSSSASESSTPNPNTGASSTQALPNSPTSSASSSVDSLTSSNQPTSHTVPSSVSPIYEISSGSHSSTTSHLISSSSSSSSSSKSTSPANTESVEPSTPALIPIENASTIQTSTDSASPATAEQSTVASTQSDESTQQSTTATPNEEITNNAV